MTAGKSNTNFGAGEEKTAIPVRISITMDSEQLQEMLRGILVNSPSVVQIRLDRAREHYSDGAEPESDASSHTGPKLGQYARRLLLKPGRDQFLCVSTDQIEWIEAANQYVRLHAGKHVYLERGSMKRFETELDSARFVRIHRSAIVNLDHVREVRTEGGGSSSRHWVVLASERRLQVSRGNWVKLKSALHSQIR